jgi:hypothetical protein
MGRIMELKEWGTLAVESASASRTQDRDEWIDTSRYESCTVCVEAPQVTGGTLALEGGDNVGGVFDELLSLTAPARTTYVLLRRSDETNSPTRLPRYLRWAVTDGGSGAGEFCFRITCTFK